MIHTHMPFKSLNTAGIERLLSVRQGGLPWKLHADTTEGRRALFTGFPEPVVECSPTFHQRDDGWIRASYVAGGSPKKGPYRAYALYTARYDSDLQLIEKHAVVKTFSGCVSPVGIAYTRFNAETEYTTYLYYSTLDSDAAWVVPGRIYRVGYDPTRPSVLTLSGNDGAGEYAMLFDTRTNEQWTVLCDGEPAYKFAIDPENPTAFQYAKREGTADFEARQVVDAQSTVLTEQIRLQALS